MRLSFRNGLVLVAVLVPLMAASAVFAMALIAHYEQFRQEVKESLNRDVRQTVQPLHDATTRVRDHARILASAVAALSDAVPGPVEPAVAELLHREINSEPLYDQIRLIGPPGDANERVRFNRIGGRVIRVAEEMLQPKGHRDYYQAAVGVPMGHAVLNITLNREYGAIEEDRPMLRAAAPVYSAGRLTGVVVINVDFRQLVEELKAERVPIGADLYIAGPSGYWYAHPDPTKTFGFERAGGGRVADEFPELAADLPGLSAGDTWVRRLGDGWVSAYLTPLTPGARDNLAVVLVGGSVDMSPITVAGLLRSAMVTLPLMVLAGSIAVVLRRRFAVPLVTVAGWAERIERGDYQLGPLPEGDEAVREFASRFSAMAALLARRENDLQRRNADLEEFAHVASHDLKAPLRAVSNLALVIEEDAGDKLDDENRQRLQLLRRRAKGMHDLIDGLLAYGSLGSEEPQPVPVALGPMLRDLIGSLALPDDFHVELNEPLPTLNAEPSQLWRIFQNLIINAADHHDAPGGHVWISAREMDTAWRIEVADDGPGVPAHAREQIFRMFSNSGKPGHLGLGLAVVRKLVLSNRGSIGVADNAPRGAVFRIEWPKPPAG